MKTISSFSSKLLALGLVFLSVISTYAYDFQSGDLSYTITSDAEPYTVSVARAFQQDIGIPKDTITKVVIPATVTHEDITYSVTSVAGYAFSSCSFLTTVKIPESIVTIGMSAFEGCIFAKDNFINHSSLDAKLYRYWGAIIVDQELDGLLIRNDTIIDCRTNVTSVVIPNTITAIGKEAFFACHLLSVTIPSSVTSIGDYAFCNCTLPSVTIPTSVTSIGNYAFSLCALSSITIPNSITSISNNVFADCTSLQQVTIPNSVTSIGNCAFQNCTSLSSFTIPGSVSSIGFNAFYNTAFYNNESNWNNGLYKDNCFIEAAVGISGVYTIKDGTRLIADEAFVYCKLMTSVLIPNSVKVIGKGAFSRISSLESVIIPNGVEFLADRIFSGCTSLTSVTLPESIISIGKNAFNLCTSLTSISLPNSIADIGTYAFSYCTSLANISIPDKIKSIQQYTFRNCESLTSVCIPNSVTDIKEGAFTRCSALTSITIPSSVTNIDEAAFYWCDALDSVTCYAITPPILHRLAFQKYNAILCVPAESVETYKATDQWKNFTQILPIAENPENLFPTLWGLQRTSFTEYFDSGHQPESEPVLLQAGNIKEIGGKLYLDFGQYLREENGKIYIYSELLQKDFVLYDFTLELGDTLTTLNWDYNNPNSDGTISVVDYAVDCPIDTLIVTDISTITLLDGKEYKKWIFNHGYFGYVESIGTLSGLFYELSQSCMVVPGCYMGDHLVCASKNGKLLYQMDDAEMERLGAECLCNYDSGHRKDNAKDGQIGGRPTPTQWNQLEVVLREMDNNHTILQAETFSYTLEDISQQVNNKTYFQLARQSTKDTATTKSVVGALHFGKDEDNRVYFLRDGVEYVLYDFTAEPGDTIEIFAGINNYPQETTYTHVVVDKDTTEDGACRMFLEVVFPEETTTVENAEKVWLAGLGSVDGIVHNAAKRASNAHAAPSRTAHSNDTQTSVMLCAWREDSCLYTTDHPDYDSFGCVYNQDPTSVENTHSPSPTTDYKKLLRNGQLLIIHNGKTYNILGIAVE